MPWWLRYISPNDHRITRSSLNSSRFPLESLFEKLSDCYPSKSIRMLVNGTVHIVPSALDVFLPAPDFPIYILRGRFCPVCLLRVCRVHFKDICAHAFPGTLDTEPAVEQWQLPVPLMATLQSPSTINLFVMCVACVLFRTTQGENNICKHRREHQSSLYVDSLTWHSAQMGGVPESEHLALFRWHAPFVCHRNVYSSRSSLFICML